MIDADAFNAFEASGWERRADGYHDFFAPITSRVAGPLLDAAGVGPGSRVLDIATGPGYVAAAAASRGAEPTGLDLAREMIELAERLHPGIPFVQGDAERLQFPDGSFDAVVANFAILHVGRPELMVGELARVLRPGGRVALTVWDVPERARLIGVFVDAVARAGGEAPDSVPAGPDFFRFADDAEMLGLLAAAGLGEATIDALEFTHALPSPAELWDGMLGGTVRIRALVEGQPPTVRRRIRSTFDELVAEHASSAGIEIPVRVKLAAAGRPA